MPCNLSIALVLSLSLSLTRERATVASHAAAHRDPANLRPWPSPHVYPRAPLASLLEPATDRDRDTVHSQPLATRRLQERMDLQLQ